MFHARRISSRVFIWFSSDVTTVGSSCGPPWMSRPFDHGLRSQSQIGTVSHAMYHDGLRNQTGLTAIYPCPTQWRSCSLKVGCTISSHPSQLVSANQSPFDLNEAYNLCSPNINLNGNLLATVLTQCQFGDSVRVGDNYQTCACNGDF